MFNFVKVIGGLTKILGNTTGTPIGNILDALKVTWQNSAGNEVGTVTDPIYVTPVAGTAQPSSSYYGEALSVATGVVTTVLTYIVPVGKTSILERISVTGENIAYYKILKNAVVIDSKHTNFGTNLNEEFNYTSTADIGIKLVPGDIITVTVLHNRPSLANFAARLQATEF